MTATTRLGLLLPANNAVIEPDFNHAVPESVTVHAHRLWVEEDYRDDQARQRMGAQIDRGVEYLAQVPVDVIAVIVIYHSTPPGEGATDIESRLSAISGIPVVRTSSSAGMALRALGAQRVSIVSPYDEPSTEGLRSLLVGGGFDVVSADSEPRVSKLGDRAFQEQDPREILEFAAKVCRPDADAMFLPCNSWRAMDIADELERRTGKTVIAASQATLWRSLRIAGETRPIQGRGRLLSEMPAVPS